MLEPVRDVAFSPNLGRSYHMIAVASKDVHIFSLKPLTRFQPRCFIVCVNSACAECIFTHLCVVMCDYRNKNMGNKKIKTESRLSVFVFLL